jgi:hypothetical protein
MALTIYPADGWDSYVSETEATALLTAFVINITGWTALTSPQREVYLRQATQVIKGQITDPEEDTTPNDLELATAYLADYARTTDLFVDSASGNLKRIKIEGAIEKEFFSKGKASNSFPSLVSSLLTQYGYSDGTKIERS